MGFPRDRPSVVSLLTCVLLVLGQARCCPQAQAQNEEDVFLSDLYGSSTTQEPPAAPSLKMDDDNLVQGGCECVPYYQCKNDTNTPNDFGEGVIDIRFGEDKKCHYLEVCCTTGEQIPPEEATRKPVPQKTLNTCGNHHPQGVGFRITGGKDNEANYGEFPWMVAVLRKDHVGGDVYLNLMECGGSIIHPQVILTGAHCVKQKPNLYIRAGEWDTQTENEHYPIQERNVTQVIIHEEFYGGALLNDAALLVLESPLELTEVVGTVCLPEQGENMDDRNCLVSGWGKDVFGKDGKYQVILKRVEQPIVPYGKCQSELRKTRLGARFKLHQSFLCAGGQVGKDACKGDGGSPLVCPHKSNPKQYVQAGIVAWGIGCGTEVPAVYAKVAYFRSWIDRKLASLNLH